MARSFRNRTLAMLAMVSLAASSLWGQDALFPAGDPATLEVRLSDRGAFGMVAIDKNKLRRRLTYSPVGSTNSAVFSIDGKIAPFGSGVGALKAGREKIPTEPVKENSIIWSFDKITITQQISIRPGDKSTQETCQVQYQVFNEDAREHKVGLRFLLDILIGANDAPSCALPGSKELISKGWNSKDKVPAYLTFRQFPSLQKPGMIAFLSLPSAAEKDKVNQVQITTLPRDTDDWEIPHVEDLKEDSVVVMYWNPRDIPANDTRTFTFAYGLDVLETMPPKKSKTQ